jgi:hypothetical protein
MNLIKVKWELTPNQRSELLNALLLLRSRRSKEWEYLNDPDWKDKDIETLINLTAALKCGDPHCSYCGES